MHDQEHERSDAGRRTAHRQHDPEAHDIGWEAARRAVATGQTQAMAPAAVLRLQRLAGNAGVGALVDQDEEHSPVLDVVGKAGGAPLPTDVRSQMERGLGADFGDVRVHDGGAAASSARSVQAKAYTVGNELVFNEGAYQPQSDEGRRTLAHELTHVVQQRAGPVDGTPTGDGVAISHPTDRFEREAEAAATMFDAAAGGAPDAGPAAVRREVVGGTTPPAPVQRDAGPTEEEPVQEMPLQRDGDEEEAVQEMSMQREEQEEEVPEGEDLTGG